MFEGEEGTGAEVMRRIAAPMIGGMITAPLLSMLVIPAAYLLMRCRSLAAAAHEQEGNAINPLVSSPAGKGVES
jgi:Cu(I)/Ag(I) efflux system membrane protein CusA/SilA